MGIEARWKQFSDFELRILLESMHLNNDQNSTDEYKATLSEMYKQVFENIKEHYNPCGSDLLEAE